MYAYVCTLSLYARLYIKDISPLKQNYFSNGTLHWITEEPIQGTFTPGYIQHKDPRERCQQGR